MNPKNKIRFSFKKNIKMHGGQVQDNVSSISTETDKKDDVILAVPLKCSVQSLKNTFSIKVNQKSKTISPPITPPVSTPVSPVVEEPSNITPVSEPLPQTAGYKTLPETSTRLKICENKDKLNKSLKGGNLTHDPLYDLALLGELYETTNIEAYIILPKWNTSYNKKFVECKLNKFAFALFVMLSYRLPTCENIIEKFARKLKVNNVNNPHWIEIRSNNVVLAEYAYPFNTLYTLQRTINSIEKNSYVDALLANFIVENVSNKVTINDPRSSILGKIARIYNKAENILVQNKMMSDFDRNIDKLYTSRGKLLEELSKLQTLMTGVFNETIVSAMYVHIANLSRPCYNEMLLTGIKYAK